MNILVSGCSFTFCHNDGGNWTGSYVPNHWPNHLDKRFKVTNIGRFAARNQYIANGVISELSQKDYDHVLVMWSGLTRLDILTDVSDSTWLDILKEYHFYGVLKNTKLAYVFSGGLNGSWRDADSLINKMFNNTYKMSSRPSLATNSLLEMIKLQNYLKHRNINYHFMSYVNYWNDKENLINGNFGLFQYPELQYLIKQIDFSKWIFSDKQYNGVYELALKNNDFYDDNFHPGLSADKAWAELINSYLY